MNDTERIETLVRRVLGEPALAVTRMPVGICNTVYDVTMPNHSVIMRLNTDPAVMAGTAENLERLAGLGLPVPQLLFADLSRHHAPWAYLILDKLPGRDLRYELDGMSASELETLARQVVGFQRVAATLPSGDGYGWAAIGRPGPHRTWTPVVEEMCAAALAGPPVVAMPDLASRIARLLDGWRTRFDTLPPRCFLDDLTTKNVIVERGRLSGIVDFDWLCYGDPLWWLGLTRTALVRSDPAKAACYMDALCREWGATAEDRRIIAFYAALHAAYFTIEPLEFGATRDNAPILVLMAAMLRTAEGEGTLV